MKVKGLIEQLLIMYYIASIEKNLIKLEQENTIWKQRSNSLFNYTMLHDECNRLIDDCKDLLEVIERS